MARIEGGDLVALEIKCHLDCLTGLRNCHRSFKQNTHITTIIFHIVCVNTTHTHACMHVRAI